jgi:hypothetical protein
MDISAFFMPIVTLVTALITALDLGQFRFSRRKMMRIITIELILQAVVCGMILLLFGYNGYAISFFLTIDMPALIVYYYTSKFRDLRDMFTVTITIFLSFMISIPAMWISELLHTSYNLYNLIRIILFAILFTFMHLFVRKHYIQIQNEMVKGWGIFSVIPVMGSIFLYFQFLQYSLGSNITHVFMNCSIITLVLALTFWVFFYILRQLHEKYLLQEQQRILDIQDKAQQDQFQLQKENADKANRRWHDLRHSTQELIELLEEGNSDAALIYLKEQLGMNDLPKVQYCMHPAVNSILCLWTERSRKAGIDVDIKVDVPEKLEIDPMELSALFANAYENAYESCLRLPKGEHSFISVETHYSGKRLAIGFKNSSMSDVVFENDIPVSSKKGGGIGTRSITYTVQRFRGTSYFGIQDNVFHARFVLNVASERN